MATVLKDSESARIHRQLAHPVVDSDGHWLETVPVFLDYLRDVAGADVANALVENFRGRLDRRYEVSPAEIARQRMTRMPWWVTPGTALDRATGMIPKLMYERLADFGVDFSLIYPTMGLSFPGLPQTELRRASIRAYNIMAAEMLAPYADRLRPVAIIPAHTPDEALEELDFAIGQLGMKGVMFNGTVRRPIDADAEWQADASKRRSYIDTLALDSPYDYEPVWAKFAELKVAVTSHGGSLGWMDRMSTSNSVCNHLGHFAQANHALCRALFLAGVTYRYPTLNFAFLEGGIGWACNLYADLIGHWEKRHRDALLRTLDPANLDLREMRELLEQFGEDSRIRQHIDAIMQNNLDPFEPSKTLDELSRRDHDADEFAAVPIVNEADIERLFARPFYFGCESDDPITAWAFDGKLGTKLQPIFSSDISHFDVTDMTEVLEEAYELVEHKLITEEDFREFTFTNAVTLHGRVNPHFFDGTAVEAAARAELQSHTPAEWTPTRLT